MTRFWPAFGTALLIAFTAAAADPQPRLSCSDRGNNGREARACEMREVPMPAASRLEVDATPNGGITVAGWSQAGILVRAKVEAWGPSDSDATSKMKEVRIETGGGKVTASGPREGITREQKWSVSYEVFVPRKIDLHAETVNGGIKVADITGNIQVEAVNGGLTLARLAGRLRAETTNGGINVELAGTTWQGDSFDVETTNGGVKVEVPMNYSARFEAETTNGGISSDLPNTHVDGKSWIGKRVSATVGSGGPLMKIETTNGGIRLQSKSGA